MTPKPSQVDRVRQAARSFKGTCQSDWLVDGGHDGLGMITRVARCIQDLEDKHDCTFECIGWRHKTKIYRILSEPDVESGRRPTPEPKASPPPPVQPATPAPALSLGGESGDSRGGDLERALPAAEPGRLFEVGKAELGYGQEEAA